MEPKEYYDHIFMNGLNALPNNNNLYKFEKKIVLNTPHMRLPFGIDRNNGNITFKLEFTKLGEDIYHNQLHETILEIEKTMIQKLRNKLEIPELKIKSQIKQIRNFKPNVEIKISKIKNKIKLNIINKYESGFSLSKIKKNDFIKVQIFCDSIWLLPDQQAVIKLKAIEITY
jgi:hypothetical protein